ncbi:MULTISPECIES: glycosyltransferase family 2 protein [Proteiniphilum]|uniref:glycosyltransferase family 2 protein n=1 Tax=Proteiniphilum TaxID=294702 RepID=UPI00036D6FE5|nr:MULTISPECIES: glycosyltransferase [Proteiniphilum]
MKISIVMAAYNAEEYIKEAIDSVLRQSFTDFEFIIVDDGSTDTTRDIIRSYVDNRIRLIENKHNFTDSINKGLSHASGKYIAFMDNDDIMHIDRLKIEHAIMEEWPDITVCSSTMKLFGKDVDLKITGGESGIIKNPLLKFIGGDYISNPTGMIRTDFLRKKNIGYENYSFASDYKFWVEVAKAGGIFYIESQPLMYYRLSKGQASQKFQKEQQDASLKIRNEIVQYLIIKNKANYPELEDLFSQFESLVQKELLTNEEILMFYQNLYSKNKDKIITN